MLTFEGTTHDCACYCDCEEYVLLEIELHDLETGSNWTAMIWDSEHEVGRQWMSAEALLDEAGFLLGWRPDGVCRGSIDHFVLDKEALERSWPQHAADLMP